MDCSTGAAAAPTVVESAACSYAQVAFRDIPHSYPPAADVTCSYTLCPNFRPNNRDWVGIFKVGWSTTKEYHTFVWVEQSQDAVGSHPVTRQAVFKEYYLPKDDLEFFQFCYVDSGGQVRGASTSFCFSRPADQSLDCGVDDDLLVVTTQEQVEKSVREKAELQSELDVTRAEIQTLNGTIQSQRQEVADLKVENETKEKEKIELEEKLKQISDKMKILEATLKQQENERLKEELSVQRTEEAEQKKVSQSLTMSRNKEEKYDRALLKINQLKDEREKLKATVDNQSDEINNLNAKVRETERELSTMSDSLQLLEVDLQSSQRETDRLSAELHKLHGLNVTLDDLKRENTELCKRLAQTQTTQRSQDDQHHSKVECEGLSRQLEEVKAKLALEREEVKKVHQREQHLEKELERVEQQLQKVVTAYEAEQRKSGKLELKLGEFSTVMADKDIALQEKEQTILLERDEIAELTKRNQALRSDIEGLRRVYAEYHSNAANAESFHSDDVTPSDDITTSYQEMEEPKQEEVIYDNIGMEREPQEEEALVCRHCQESFPGITSDELELHEQSHRVCPFCTLICDAMDQSVFEDHVYGHEL